MGMAREGAGGGNTILATTTTKTREAEREEKKEINTGTVIKQGRNTPLAAMLYA